jgi:hypothetical protein
MKSCPVLALLLASGFFACAETEEHLTQRFPVQPGGRLIVEVEFGSIEVKTNGDNAVTVDVLRTIGRSSKAEEEEYLADRPVIFTPDGDTVTISSQPKTKAKAPSRGRQTTKGMYRISVPSRFAARLKTDGGAIAVTDLHGEVQATSAGGGLNFTRTQGRLEGRTAGGAIKAEGVQGTQTLKTSGGGIEVSGGTGACEAATLGGSVTVKDFEGSVQLKSGGGGIEVENVAGRVDGKTSGGAVAARFSKAPLEAVNLATAGGGVTLQVTGEAAFDLDATAAGGSVHSELAVGEAGAKPARGHLKGPVNGGGKPIMLRSGGGSIEVRKL